MTKRLFLLVSTAIAFGLAFPACQLAVEVDVPEAPPRLVVNSIFSADQKWMVKVTRDRFILDDAPFDSVRGANVVIRDDSGTEFTLTESKGGIYRSDLQPVIGQSYTIRVSASSFETAEATAAVPGEILIESVFIDSASRIESTSQLSESVPVEITFTDPGGERDYYHLAIQQFDVVTYVDPVTKEEKEYTQRFYRPFDLNDPLFDDPGPEGLFEDVLFDGQTHTMRIFMLTNTLRYFPEDGNRPFFPPGRPIRTSTIVKFQLWHVSEEYYRYWITATLQADSRGNPLAEPVQVFGNIENGFGIFAGYSESVFQVGGQ